MKFNPYWPDTAPHGRDRSRPRSGECTCLSIGFRQAVARYGFDTAEAYLITYHDAVDILEKLVAEEGIDCDFARTGKLLLASEPAHVEGPRKTHRDPAHPPGRDPLRDRLRPFPWRNGRRQERRAAR